jgi:hypothetical protein
MSVSCPEGELVLSGGARIFPAFGSGTTAPSGRLVESYPDSDRSWTTRISSDNIYEQVVFYAVCATGFDDPGPDVPVDPNQPALGPSSTASAKSWAPITGASQRSTPLLLRPPPSRAGVGLRFP